MKAIYRIHRLALGMIAMAALPAVAQDEAGEELEEVVVTGSRVMDLQDSVSPVVVVGAEDLLTRPTTSVTEYLQRHLTSNYAAPDFNQETSTVGFRRNAGDRQTGVNLRGLGPHNSLILIDGRRTIEYPAFNRDNGWRTVDLNTTIPSIAVGAVQVMADGGSAIYGSDAVAGVINILPAYNFRGAKFQARSTVFQDEFGTPDSTFGALFGAGDERTNLIFAAEYRQSNPLTAFQTGNRAYYPDPTVNQDALDDRRDDGIYTFAPLTGTRLARGALALADPLCGDHAALGMDPIGAGIRLANTPTTVGMGRGAVTTAAASERCEVFQQRAAFYQQLDRDDIAVFSAVEHELAPIVRLSAEISYSQKQQVDLDRTGISFQSYFSNGNPGILDLNIPNDHPGVQYNRSVDPRWDNADGFEPIGLNMLSFDDPLFSRHEYDLLRGTIGFEVDLTDDWTLDANYVRATNTVRNSVLNAHVERFQRALVGLGGEGCSTTATLQNAGNGGCQYFNPFMSAALPDASGMTYVNAAGAAVSLANDPDLVKYITPEDLSTFRSDFSDLSLTVTGFAGRLPGGEIGWSAGYAKRTDDLSVERSGYSQSASLYQQSLPANNFGGDASVESMYFEAALPLTDRLNVQIAGRNEDHSIGFSSFDPKIGFNWAATDRLTLRGSYGTSFRAPTIIHSGDIRIQERRFLWLGDNTIISPGNAMRANFQLVSYQTGNPDLQPQSADNITFGGDYRFDLEGHDLSISADYVNVDFRNLIQVVTIAARMAEPECHISEQELGNIASPRGRRPDVWELIPINPEVDANGRPAQFGSCFDFSAPYNPNRWNTPTAVHGTSKNFSRVQLQAVDFGLSYGTDTRFGYLSLRPQLTWVVQLDQWADAESEVVESVGTLTAGRYDLVPTMPDFRLSFPVGIDNGSHSLQLVMRHLSEVKDRVDATAIAAATYMDFNYMWNYSESLRVGLFIDNVTGEVNLDPAAQSFLPPYERRFGAQFVWDIGE